jgi:uncharacterized zinc-type alcohol dehydrogenase-like protein
MICGHEVIAEVSLVGRNVKDYKKGDKVCFPRDCCDKCKYCTSGKENFCKNTKDFSVQGRNFFGGFATQLQQSAKFYTKLQEKLNLKKAPSLICSGCTVYSLIKHHCKKGDNTAVIGIGGLGHLAV